MKKLLSYIILGLLIVSSNPGWSLAMEQILPPLEREKDRTERILENLADRVDNTLERADNRILDPEQSEKIQEKQEEIQALLEEVKTSLDDANNKTEVKEILEETKNIIVLKTSAALTPTEDITEDPSLQRLASVEKAQAETTLLASLDSGERNTIMIRSRSREDIIREKLAKYDDNLTMDFQFEEDGYKIYEISVDKSSLLSEELLENLDEGEVPESVLGIEIIRPELLQIGTIDFTGEDRVKLWGIEQYTTPAYLESLEVKSNTLTRKIRVGIIDTGIESTHRDLAGQVNTSLGYDFVNEDSDPTDDQGHGTHVAGTIAGRVNSTGVFGVNPYVELVGLKICDNKGFCPSYSVLKALSYAKEHNFDVLNMSLGARGNPETSPICSAVKDITAGGTIVVAAAGNSNVDTSTFVPGGCRTAITVAAVDEGGRRAAFSNYGTKVDVAAPGVGIYSSYIGGGYKSLNGTSMATPHIVGLVSVIKTYRRDMGSDEVKMLLKKYTTSVTSDSIKPIASGVDVSKLITMLAGTQTTVTPEQKVETTISKEEPKKEAEPEVKINTDKDLTASTGSLDENIGIIDENIGLIIQNHEEKVEINSISEGETVSDENTVRINSDEGEESPVTEGESESIGGNSGEEYSTETVEINSADTEIDFENLDLSGALSSDGVGEKAERTTIDIDPAYIPESNSVEINSDEGEESPASLIEGGEESTGEDTGDTMIQNTYYCTMYVGGSCGYGLPAASIRQYQSTNSSIISLSVGSNSFTLYGQRAGSSTLYVKYAGRTLATIYVTVTQPVTPLRAYYGASSVMVGGSTYLTISSGNGGYSVTSSNSNIISVSGYNTNWTLSARGAGTATVNYRDSRGQYGNFTITVTAPARDIRANIGARSIETDRTTTLSITDGNGGYSVTSSNSSVASVSGGNASWTITARTPGITTLNIRDSRGKNLSITVTVLTPSKTLRYRYGTTSLQVGGSSMISILDGNGGYSVTSSNSSIISVSGGNASWTIRGVAAGTATITLRDSRGKSATLTYTVLAPPRQVKGTLSNTSPRIGDTITFTVTDGNGGYSVTSSNPSIISVVSGSDKNWTLRANSTGQATITVSDSRGSRGSILVNVQSGSKPLTLSTYAITVEIGSDAYFQVTSGNGGYSHSRNNTNAGWYFMNSAIPSYRVRGVTPGTTILQIRDSSGKVAQVVVTVEGGLDAESKAFLDGFNSWFLLFLQWASSLNLSSAEEDGVEINSEPTSEICELGRAGQYWARPYNAVCVDNVSNDAWTCSGKDMVSLFSSHGINSCIDKRYTYIVKDILPSVKSIQINIGSLSESQYQIRARIQETVTKRNAAINNAKSLKTKATATIIYDTLLNELYKKLYPQAKELQDILSTHYALGHTSGLCDPCEVSTRSEIESKAMIMASKTFEYKLKYDAEFQRGYNNSINTLLARGGTRAEIEQGIKEGITEGTRDYIMSYYDTVKSLSELKWDNIASGMNGAWQAIQSPVASAQGIFASYKTTIEGLYQKVTHLSGYEGAKGGTYLGTNMGLSAADPAGKILKLAGGSFFTKIGGKLDGLVAMKLAKVKWSKVPKPDMSKIANNDLKNAINDIYRDSATIGNGSTADAIRYTKATGIKIGDSDHIIKGQESIKRLENLIKTGLLGDSDKGIATRIILDIRDALNGN